MAAYAASYGANAVPVLPEVFPSIPPAREMLSTQTTYLFFVGLLLLHYIVHVLAWCLALTVTHCIRRSLVVSLLFRHGASVLSCSSWDRRLLSTSAAIDFADRRVAHATRTVHSLGGAKWYERFALAFGGRRRQ